MGKQEFTLTHTHLHGFFVPADEDDPVTELSIDKPSGAKGTTDEDILQWRQDEISKLLGDVNYDEDCLQVLLIRPSGQSSGLMAYYAQVVEEKEKKHQAARLEADNINSRATGFGMTCGLLNSRFVGDVIILNLVAFGRRPDKKTLLTLEEFDAACKTPDIRPTTLKELGVVDAATNLPDVIADAVVNNYHDKATLRKFETNMKRRDSNDFNYSTSGESVEEYMFANSDVESEPEDVMISFDTDGFDDIMQEDAVIAEVPVCLNGGWFNQNEFAHDCLSETWELYTSRREKLSTFPLGEWTEDLTTEENQKSKEPYEKFLNGLGINSEVDTWWKAEFGEWSGGMNGNAQKADLAQALTYQEGFAPITDIPAEEAVHIDTLKSKNWDDTLGVRKLADWAEYYELRGIPKTSPVALLMTFPLTLYHAIVEYGKDKCDAARGMDRPLRVDIVGAEKELHFLSIFQEVAFLLPDDLKLELIFIVRRDMLPQAAFAALEQNDGNFSYEKSGLNVKVVCGTYGESVDPRFDLGHSGGPDMVMAFNAGLHAFETWRSCVEYLHATKDVVGVFTDYNEWSGVQSAALGGQESRLSLKINPFRQPLHMPESSSTELPQFSNGFMYVFNQHAASRDATLTKLG
mmetsp:Transcript_18327/g.50038  ORF Transcript_18327/g.50038 Transcript_18327/m.50038 type:complete len:633 (-) Transcript_18327:3002-4900(-)